MRIGMAKYVMGFLIALFAQIVMATTPADDFGARKWPVSPRLTVNTQPELCNLALAQAKATFDSTAIDLDIEHALSTKIPALQWIPLTQTTNEEPITTLFTLTLDLDGNGSKQIVLYRNLPFNWSGNWHYSYVFQHIDNFNDKKDEIIKNWSSLSSSQDQNSTENSLNAIGYFPSSKQGDKDVFTGNVWADHNLFKFKNAYYFFQASTNWDRMNNPDAEIYQLHGDGHVEQRCKISFSSEKEQYQTFVQRQRISSFIAIIRGIGSGGPDIGSGHFGLVHDGQAVQSEHRAAYRPWALNQSRDGYYIYDERLKSFLEEWSFFSAWNRREYQTLLEAMEAAEPAETDYLKETFGLTDSQAKQRSKVVLQQLLAARILIPSGYELTESSRSLYFPFNKFFEIVLKRNKAELDALPNQKIFEINAYTKFERDSLVAYAIEWPYGLNKLLTAGANPNTQDAIQKTPIMVASHLNRPDAVRRLLKAGADVNAKTKSETAYSQEAIINDRTALMYAAENASPVVMKILIDAGADLNAKDSKGQSIASYLAKNPRLTDEEKSLSIKELANQAERFSKVSFDCSKATTAIEKSICTNEVLSIYDNELNRAYLTAKNRLGSAFITEQKGWLIRRNSTCIDDEKLFDCVADMTRTRIRYIHSLIVEKQTPSSTEPSTS